MARLGGSLHGFVNLVPKHFRIQRIQKEKEEMERKQAEAASGREQQQREFIRAKEMEILQLQVR